MNQILEFLTKGIRGFLQFLFDHFRKMIQHLGKAQQGIPRRYLFSDFFAVLRSAGMYTFFNLVALVVFTVLPQGKDILLIIAEDLGGKEKHFGNLLWLLIGVVFWSILSEYGTRYSIYVTDNSGNSLPDRRVVWRKAVQRSITEIFLMLPYFIVFIGFLINYIQDTSLTKTEKNWGFGIPVLCLYLVFTLVANFYFSEKREVWRKNPKNSLQKFALLPPKEWDWCNKLLGIYNRYVFVLRRPSNFTNKIRGPYQVFCHNFLNPPEKGRRRFPKNKSYIAEDTRVPVEFRLKEYTDDGENTREDNLNGSYKWTYEIPLNFYRTLHRQLKVISIFCITLFLLVSFMPVHYYQMVGAPGLVVISFGCWSGIYAGLLYLDYALLRSFFLSLRFMLTIVFILCSFLNKDHPVRYNDYRNIGEHRPALKAHFLNWFDNYRKDSLNTLYYLKSDSSKHFYPVVFVCAEGGALRTGAFTAMALSFLQDSISRHYGIDVRNSVYAYSGVSGGALGISFFNAMAYLSEQETLKRDSSYTGLSKLFFQEDYLAPVIGKMFFADIVNLFLPFTIPAFDRAIALEKAWELGYEKIIRKENRNVFSSDFRSLYQDQKNIFPAFFINTTEAETGRQCWLTNVRPDSSFVFAGLRDLLAYKIRGGINYSTMTNFSSRFPLFSPGAAIEQDPGKKFHYLDGGYVENTGTGTMLEILKALTPVFDTLARQNCYLNLDTANGQRKILIKPFVLILQYNQNNDGPPDNIDFANEVSEILHGIYNTRSGRSTTALEEIQRYTRYLGGECFVLPLQKTGSEVPMNWVLSKRSLTKIEEDIKEKWENRNKNMLRKFFAIDTNTRKYRQMIRKAELINQ